VIKKIIHACTVFFQKHTGLSHYLQKRKLIMANINDTLADLLTLDGAMCAAVVDANSGMLLGKAGSGLNLEVAAAGNTEVVRAKLKTMKALGLNGHIEDILITLDSQYHIITMVQSKEGLFMYTVLDKAKSNLAMARYKANEAQGKLAI